MDSSKKAVQSRKKDSVTDKVFLLVIFFLFITVSVVGQVENIRPDVLSIRDSLNRVFKKITGNQLVTLDCNYLNGRRIKIDSLYWNATNDTLSILFNNAVAELPLREESLLQLNDTLTKYIAPYFGKIAMKFYSNKIAIEQLIPNYYYANNGLLDSTRLPQKNTARAIRNNLVEKQRGFEISNGLKHSNIALWNSHGWYYEPKLDRWEWQRARLFTTVEDISPTSFVIPYILPMLENAGATAMIPRERDWQTNEVIVDKDGSTGHSRLMKKGRMKKKSGGFAIGTLPYKHENPFLQGTYLDLEKNAKRKDLVYLPEIPENGEYGVYVSYAKGEGEVTYRVYHTGGFTDYKVDQRMGYGTWVYLGKFSFDRGKNKETGKVVLLTSAKPGQQITADAVRFGGGMGLIERYGQTSGRAKYFEGARYFLQYSGAPDTLVWSFGKDKEDYGDDYKSRGEWANWLIGKPFGPNKNRDYPGLGVPIDLSLAFHTDAGILPGDGIIGTLGIYSTTRDNGLFPDGQSKYASRDLTDLIQTQIVEDISKTYKVGWTRRGMWNSEYSESYRPNVPCMLLELLSHQNLNDIRYLLHPQYKFDVSRAIYKGMLRFVSTQYGYKYVVQPLPVDHLSTEFSGENEIILRWLPVSDSLETTAAPDKYMVYQRTGDNGFDNGTLTDKPEMKVSNLEKGMVYGFKVTAVNAGGESFPSEIVSVGIAENSKGNVLIVNGFDRIDSPQIFETDSLSGVMRFLDHGVAYGYDISTVGDQYDFNRKSPWLDDDSSGHGASAADLETTIFRANTFDFAGVHGHSILNSGYNFVTSSDEVVESGNLDLSTYKVIDLLYGEEKSSRFPGKDSTIHFPIYTENMLTTLEKYTQNGGNLFISGAYIGSEIAKDMATVNRIGKLFGYKWRTDHAVRTGGFTDVLPEFDFSASFNTDYNMEQYPVEAPDAIEPFNEKTKTWLRYTENNTSAGTIYQGTHKVAALGFPFESVKTQPARDAIMKQILTFITQ